MRSLIQTILIAVISSAIGASLVYYASHKEMKKTGVVDAVKLFSSYDMKREMESKEEVRLRYLGHILDSLSKGVKLSPDDKALTSAAIDAKQRLDEEYRAGNAAINEQVWKRLNPAVDEWGRKNSYHLIIGANGMGSVLYNDSYYDLTDELILYVNKEYQGAQLKVSISLHCCAAFAIAGATGISSCKHSLDAKEYLSYVTAPSNGLNREVKSAGWVFKIQYEPPDYILLKEFGKSKKRKRRIPEATGSIKRDGMVYNRDFQRRQRSE